MPRFRVPAGVPGINFGGAQFNADADGVITLPEEGNYCLPTGYERVPDPAPAVPADQFDDTQSNS